MTPEETGKPWNDNQLINFFNCQRYIPKMIVSSEDFNGKS